MQQNMNIVGGKGEANHKQTLNYREQTGLLEGNWVGGTAKCVVGVKEGTCDEHWVLYVSDEPLNSTSETNTTLYVK